MNESATSTPQSGALAAFPDGVERVNRTDRELNVALKGKLVFGRTDVAPIREFLARQLDGDSFRVVRLDCHGVSFIDSQGLGMLLATHRLCQDRQARLVIDRPSDKLRQQLRLTRMDTLIEVVPS